MNTLKCYFLEWKTITSKKDGNEYPFMSVLCRDKFGYRVMDLFMPKEFKVPKFLQEITLTGFWIKKDDKWQFRVLGGK